MSAPDSVDTRLRVDFYVLASTSEDARLRVACRLCEKGYGAGQRVAVLCADEAERRRLDDLLWTFADGSFVPHELADPTRGASLECPVVLSCGTTTTGPPELIVNLGTDPPLPAPSVQRIAEIIDAEEGRRAAGRRRFKHYRSLGIEPQSHHLGASTTL